jgi:hypothetical protein
MNRQFAAGAAGSERPPPIAPPNVSVLPKEPCRSIALTVALQTGIL